MKFLNILEIMKKIENRQTNTEKSAKSWSATKAPNSSNVTVPCCKWTVSTAYRYGGCSL